MALSNLAPDFTATFLFFSCIFSGRSMRLQKHLAVASKALRRTKGDGDCWFGNRQQHDDHHK